MFEFSKGFWSRITGPTKEDYYVKVSDQRDAKALTLIEDMESAIHPGDILGNRGMRNSCPKINVVHQSNISSMYDEVIKLETKIKKITKEHQYKMDRFLCGYRFLCKNPLPDHNRYTLAAFDDYGWLQDFRSVPKVKEDVA